MQVRKWLLRLIAALLALCLLIMVGLIIANRALPTRSTVAARLSDGEKAHLSKFFHLRRALGDAARSGWGSTATPLVVYNESYAFLVGYPDAVPPVGWRRAPDDAPHGGPMEISLAQQFRRDLPAILRPIFPYALVGDIFLRGSEGYITALAHESFHAYEGVVAAPKLIAAELVMKNWSRVTKYGLALPLSLFVWPFKSQSGIM